MITVLLAALAGLGVHLVWSAATGPGHRAARRPTARRRSVESWLDQAGLEGAGLPQLLAASLAAGTLGALVAWSLFGGPVALVLGPAAALVPAATYRSRRARFRSEARDAWPRILERVRVNATSAGRALPQALLDAGRDAPAGLREAFAAAEREWAMTTDFSRCLSVLRNRLADPTCDVVVETLLVAHEVGGVDLDRRLRDLIEDRHVELHHRRDAQARQAGARFSRVFVLVVPLGMVLVGLTVGRGRAAYASAGAQLVILAAVVLIAGCWIWAGRILRLPEARRIVGAGPR